MIYIENIFILPWGASQDRWISHFRSVVGQFETMNFACIWLTHDPSITAAIIGALATVVSVAMVFIGVVLTIRDNRVRARDDRLTALRRETYLEACDVAAEAVQFIASLPDESITLASGASIMR